MRRRDFIFQSTGLALTAWAAPSLAKFVPPKDKMDRIAMGTLIFRDRFKQTKPKQVAEIKNELTLMDIPQHHRDLYGIKKIEFWSTHFESLDVDYLTQLKVKIKSAKSELLNVQFDGASFEKHGYDLATLDEQRRKDSIEFIKRWMDAAAFLGSKCVRVNPGNKTGTVENCIASFQELVPYAKSRKLTIITANHTSLEQNPDNHIAIVKGAPGIYTEPDFGNYSPASRYDSLAKISPYARIVSAKTEKFIVTDGKLEHTSYDFDRCIKIAEDAGFKDEYMIAQWSGYQPDIDYGKVAAWTIEHIKANIR